MPGSVIPYQGTFSQATDANIHLHGSAGHPWPDHINPLLSDHLLSFRLSCHLIMHVSYQTISKLTLKCTTAYHTMWITSHILICENRCPVWYVDMQVHVSNGSWICLRRLRATGLAVQFTRLRSGLGLISRFFRAPSQVLGVQEEGSVRMNSRRHHAVLCGKGLASEASMCLYSARRTMLKGWFLTFLIC